MVFDNLTGLSFGIEAGRNAAAGAIGKVDADWVLTS